MRASITALLLAAAAAASLTAQAPGARRVITQKDLFDFVWVANPQVSPDGSRVAFTRVTVDAKRTGYESAIWTVSTAGAEPPVRLTGGTHDTQPRWSPDGKRLAFVRRGPKDEEGKPAPPQIAILPLGGGEARLITDLPKGASNPVWSPDGTRLAFVSVTTQEDIEKAARKNAGAKPADADADHESDVHVITRAVYRDNDEGYLDPKRHQHIWLLTVPVAADELDKPVQLTTGRFDEGEVVWARDGSRLYYLTTPIDEPYYNPPSTDIASIPVAGGKPDALASIPMGVSDLVLSPDGRRFAFHAAVTEPVRSYSQPDLWVMDATPGAKPRNLTATYDFDIGDAVFGDNAAPRGGRGCSLSWSPDGRSLFDLVNRQGRTPMVRVDAESGAVTDYTRGEQAVVDYSIGSDARTIVALVSTPTMVGDLFRVAADGTESRLTAVNQKLWSGLNLTAPEEITYKSFDGRSVQAWIQKPPDFDPRQKYPLILNIHGGPHTAYGWVFDHEFQWMAAKGYVVLYPNPRGSTGYGQEFGNLIQYHYPGDDARDLLAGVDAVLARGFVDEKRLGVTGGSGGGVLTDWIVSHNNRFAAAVSQRDISNWASWWYTADFTLFQANWFKAPPFEDPADYANRSAITFVKDIHTPMLFVLGEEDSRTPADSGGMQLFRALKYLKRPTEMVMFPRETHELSRSGEPWHRIERLEHIVEWFDRWMK
jgi:dipeptidyl aminopeptidase/acylaminoacyl peptidase